MIESLEASGRLGHEGAPSLPEPDAHVLARRWKRHLRWLLGIFVLATVAGWFFFRSAAYLAAVPIPLLAVLYLVFRGAERATRSSELRPDGQSPPTRTEIDTDEGLIGFSTALRIAGGLAVGGLIAALIFFDWQSVGWMAAGIFLYMVALGLPVWVAAVQQSEEDEHRKLTGKLR